MEYRKDYFAGTQTQDLTEVGVTRQRSDVLGHVTGKTQYYADRQFGRPASSQDGAQSPSSRPHQIDRCGEGAGKCRASCASLPPRTCRRISTPFSASSRSSPMTSRCSPSTRCASRASRSSPCSPESEAAARAAVAKVKIVYEVLPAVFDVEEALKPGAPLVNEYHGRNYFTYEGHHCRRVRHGDVERAFAKADHVVEEMYQSSPIEHAPTETTGCIVGAPTRMTATPAIPTLRRFISRSTIRR